MATSKSEAAVAQAQAAKQTAQAAAAEAVMDEEEGGVFDVLGDWFREEGVWWLSSMVIHMLALCCLALVSVKSSKKITGEAPSVESVEVEPPKEDMLEKFDVAETPEDPTELNTETLTLEPPGVAEQTEKYYDDNPVFEEAGGGLASTGDAPQLGGAGGFDVKGLGPGAAFKGPGGVGTSAGNGKNAGSGGDGVGFGGRGQGHRKAQVGRGGGTRQSERAVAGALNWLHRHQMPEGNWSLHDFPTRCGKDGPCSGAGGEKQNVGATAMALLPFLAAGQTHVSKGPYQATIAKGIYWLQKTQKADGDLRGGGSMYSHGLASIALCEAYGMSGDKSVGASAQKAINFVQMAQNQTTGGWRYVPGDAGDTSVVGWQLMALKSAHMANLTVNPATFEKTKVWLKSCAKGQYGEQYSYEPKGGGTPAMSAVGLLCEQYLGTKRIDGKMTGGSTYLMAHMPDMKTRNTYYWYYATQVMHNLGGADWDTWNRKMRKTLIEAQDKTGCAAGSWDPEKPKGDPWGGQGGRIMMTALSALTLEVYYRYLPLYKLDTEEELKPVEKPAADAKAADAK